MLCSSCHAQRNHIDIYIDINIDIYIDIYKLTERPVVHLNAIFYSNCDQGTGHSELCLFSVFVWSMK